MTSVVVTSRSFSKHPLLREALKKRYSQAIFNEEGHSFTQNTLIDFLQSHDKAIVGLERLDSETLSHLPKLKVVSRFGVGLDTLDLQAMQRLGIKLSFTSGANKRSVAELVIAFCINMLRHLPLLNHEVKSLQWQQRKGRQLSDKTVGIIGLGAVGKDLAGLLKAFNCKILAYDKVDHSVFCHQSGIEQVELDDLMKISSIISVHLPLNELTKGILNAERLQLMKSDAILINTARGELIDEQAVKTLLMNQQLSGAAFDVFAQEPPLDQELLMHPHFFATPHIGGSTEEAILAMGYAAIEGLETASLPKV